MIRRIKPIGILALKLAIIIGVAIGSEYVGVFLVAIMYDIDISIAVEQMANLTSKYFLFYRMISDALMIGAIVLFLRGRIGMKLKKVSYSVIITSFVFGFLMSSIQSILSFYWRIEFFNFDRLLHVKYYVLLLLLIQLFIYAFLEEIVFRKLIVEFLGEGKIISVVLSAVLFVYAHDVYMNISVIGFMYFFLVAIIFSILYDVYGSLIVPTLVHTGYNYFLFLTRPIEVFGNTLYETPDYLVLVENTYFNEYFFVTMFLLIIGVLIAKHRKILFNKYLLSWFIKELPSEIEGELI